MKRARRILLYTLAAMFGYDQPRIVASFAAAYLVAAFLRDWKVDVS